jgi:hypothetical protein
MPTNLLRLFNRHRGHRVIPGRAAGAAERGRASCRSIPLPRRRPTACTGPAAVGKSRARTRPGGSLQPRPVLGQAGVVLDAQHAGTAARCTPAARLGDRLPSPDSLWWSGAERPVRGTRDPVGTGRLRALPVLALACGTPLLRAGQLGSGLDASDSVFSCVADIAICQGYGGLAHEPALWPGQWLRGITDTVLSALVT